MIKEIITKNHSYLNFKLKTCKNIRKATIMEVNQENNWSAEIP